MHTQNHVGPAHGHVNQADLKSRPPRCPPFLEAKSVDDLLPYIDAVAKRPFSPGLWPAWGLQKDERVLLRVDNWHDPMCVEAAVKILEKYGCKYELLNEDRGPKPRFEGHNEAELFIEMTKEISRWMDAWESLDASGKYDKAIWGFGGPILSERKLKVQRFPFITPEMVMSAANTIPAELLAAIDAWTWRMFCSAKRVHITDPEGTDVWYTAHDTYFDANRQFYNEEHIRNWYPQNVAYGRTYLPGHIWGKPNFLLPRGLEDGNGVVAGTMNHIGPYPHMRLKFDGSRVVDIEGGGQFGDKLRNYLDQTYNIQYPGMPGKGLFYWWEASVGTNPKIYRPRKGYLQGWNCALHERQRSGIIHIGYGSVISSDYEKQAVLGGIPIVGHWHVHLNFPTVTIEKKGGGTDTVIRDGRLLALDDPDIRKIAAKYGDPDMWLQEDWIPAVPGINVEGDYWRDYAEDPMDWTMTELHICERWHHLFAKMMGIQCDHGHKGCNAHHGAHHG